MNQPKRSFTRATQRGKSNLSAQALWSFLLDQACPVPDPVRSDEDWECYTHRDLDRLDLNELEQHQRRAIWRRDHDPRPSAWLDQRIEAIRRRMREVGHAR